MAKEPVRKSSKKCTCHYPNKRYNTSSGHAYSCWVEKKLRLKEKFRKPKKGGKWWPW